MIGRQEQMFYCSRVLFCLATLLLFRSSEAQSCSAATQSCDVCSSLCNGVRNQINVFQNSSVQPLTCPPPVGGGSFSSVRWYHRTSSDDLQGTLIDKSSSRYGGNTLDTLSINNVVPGDEGLYRCEYTLTGGTSGRADVGCVFVQGKAAFTSCNSQTCPENITVYTGQNITFDTRIMFSNSGPCGIPQGTDSLLLYRGTQISQPSDLLYVCSNTNNNPCRETYTTSTIHAVSSGGHKFSLNLTLPNAALDNGGTYTAEVEVLRPTGGRATLRKTFRVTVNSPPPPTTPPPTTPPPTTTPPSGMVTPDPTSTTQPPASPAETSSPGGPTSPGGSTSPTTPPSTVTTATSTTSQALGTIATIVAPVVCVVAVVAICGAVICVVAVYRRRSKCSCTCSDLESVKPTNEHEKSPSHHFTNEKEISHSQQFVSHRIVADYHHETIVCSNRPESMCAQDLGDFELPDNTIQDEGEKCRKKNSEDKHV